MAARKHMLAREILVMTWLTRAKPHLGRDHHRIATNSGQRRAENLLGTAVRINIGRVEHGDADIERRRDAVRSSRGISVTAMGQPVAVSNGADPQAANADRAVLHGC